MRPGQFWLLMAASLLVSGLLFRGIFLYRAVGKEHALLADCQQSASTAVEYQRMWKSIAARLYEASSQDPALAQLLKDQHIEVRPSGSKVDEVPNPATAPEPPGMIEPAAAPVATPPTTPANPAVLSGGLPVPTLENAKP